MGKENNPSPKIDRDALRDYMLSQDFDGQLIEEVKKLEEKPNSISSDQENLRIDLLA